MKGAETRQIGWGSGQGQRREQLGRVCSILRGFGLAVKWREKLLIPVCPLVGRKEGQGRKISG